MIENTILINVRYAGNTNVARAKGQNKTASYTGSKKGAVAALVKKIAGDGPYELKQYGTSDTWILTTTIKEAV